MIKFEKRIFTLEDIFEFLKAEIPGETPTRLVFNKKTGGFQTAKIEDFINPVLLQFTDGLVSSNCWVELTNFSFMFNNYRNLDIKWMRFLFKKHNNDYAPMLKNYLEQNKKKAMKVAYDKIEQFTQETLKEVNARLSEHTKLEYEVKKLLEKGEDNINDNTLG